MHTYVRTHLSTPDLASVHKTFDVYIRAYAQVQSTDAHNRKGPEIQAKVFCM